MEPRPRSTDVFPSEDGNALRDPLEAADRAMETLRAVSLQFNSHPLPTRRFLYGESVSSSRMAGFEATLLDLLCFEEAPEYLSPLHGVRGQSRYLAALDFGLERFRHGTLDANCIKGIFEILCPDVLIGPSLGKPTPCMQVMSFVARNAHLHPLLQAGLVHAHVATLELFPAANDRMARILSALVLAERKGLVSPCLCLSPFFEKHAETYARHIRSLADGADLEPWLAFFIEAARHQAVDTTRRLQALLGIMDRYRGILLRRGHGTRSAFKVMEHMVNIPLLTARTLIEKVGMSAPTAQSAIRVWVEAGVLQELTGHRSGRIYLATDLFRLATEEWKVNAA